MDQVKIGAFIAALRRERGWTQEELGERLGISNKTVSRWENGNYMPGIEMMSLLSRELCVSLNELVEGQRLEDGEDFRAAADKNLASALESPMDRLRRWLARHGVFVMVIALLCLVMAVIMGAFLRYQREHPLDVPPPGTYACRGIFLDGQYTWLYLTFDRDGRYYMFDASGTAYEYGSYALDDDVIALDGRGAVRWIVVKGERIRDTAPWGGELLTYVQVSEMLSRSNQLESFPWNRSSLPEPAP